VTRVGVPLGHDAQLPSPTAQAPGTSTQAGGKEAQLSRLTLPPAAALLAALAARCRVADDRLPGEAVELLALGTGSAQVRLHHPAGAVLAVAGVAPAGAAVRSLALTAAGCRIGWLVVSTYDDPTPQTEALLAASADVLACGLAAARLPVFDAALGQLRVARTQLADELHDGPAQLLASLSLVVSAIERGPVPGVEVTAVIAAARDGLRELRTRIGTLRPRGHDGLRAALAELVLGRGDGSTLTDTPPTVLVEPTIPVDATAAVDPITSVASTAAAGISSAPGVSPALADAAVRVIRAAIEPCSGPVRLALADNGAAVTVQVGSCGADNLVGRPGAAGELEALGGRLERSPDRLRLDLPRLPGAPTYDNKESFA